MKEAKRRSSIGSVWMMAGVAMVVVGLLIGASLWWSQRQTQVTDTNVVVPAVKSDPELHANRFTLGKPEAKAHLVEYGDFL